jgi:hypothetical protein
VIYLLLHLRHLLLHRHLPLHRLGLLLGGAAALRLPSQHGWCGSRQQHGGKSGSMCHRESLPRPWVAESQFAYRSADAP